MTTPNLDRANDVMEQARQAGVEHDLSDWVESAVSEWRNPDRTYWLRNPNSTINLLARALSLLTGADIAECQEIVQRKHGDNEIAFRVAAILDFGRQFAQARRRT